MPRIIKNNKAEDFAIFRHVWGEDATVPCNPCPVPRCSWSGCFVPGMQQQQQHCSPAGKVSQPCESHRPHILRAIYWHLVCCQHIAHPHTLLALQSWHGTGFTSSCYDGNKNHLEQSELINHLQGISRSPSCTRLLHALSAACSEAADKAGQGIAENFS